jgi:hypothetical protein
MYPPVTLSPAAEVLARFGTERPLWHAIGSLELTRLLGLHPNTVHNWKMRQTGPDPEPAGLYRKTGNKVLYRPDLVLVWLSARQGKPLPAWAWVRRWLLARRMLRVEASEHADIIVAVTALERPQPPIFQHRWRPADPARYLERLRATLLTDA